MASNNNQDNTEDANSEIRKAYFLVQENHESAVINIKILAAFNGDLDASIVAQQDSPVNYRSGFRDIAPLAKLFLHHEDKTKIINIIQQESHYHLDRIEEETWKSYLDAMILRVNHKSSHSVLNSPVLYKAINK